MSARTVASFFVVLASLVACGAPPDADEPDEGSTETESSALRPRDDGPAPIDVPVPALDVRLERPVWDLKPYIDDFQQRPRLGSGRCVLRYVKIYDPSRGHDVTIPVTICN